MKKMILTGTVIVALAGAGLSSARAGDREWATAGKVLAGVAVVGVIAAVASGHAQGSVSYSYGAPAYCPPPAPPCNYVYCPAPAPQVVYYPPPPVVYCPAPVVVYRAPVVVYPSHRYARQQARQNRW
ncbi:MAG: hypothetical protein WDN00_03065 [Limisphaerales bacterium]